MTYGIERDSDLIGRRIGSRTIIGAPFRIPRSNGRPRRMCVVQCDCGETIVRMVADVLKSRRCTACYFNRNRDEHTAAPVRSNLNRRQSP